MLNSRLPLTEQQACAFGSLLINSRLGTAQSLVKTNRSMQVQEFLPSEMFSRHSTEEWLNKVSSLNEYQGLMGRDAEEAYVKYYLDNVQLRGCITFPVSVR